MLYTRQYIHSLASHSPALSEADDTPIQSRPGNELLIKDSNSCRRHQSPFNIVTAELTVWYLQSPGPRAFWTRFTILVVSIAGPGRMATVLMIEYTDNLVLAATIRARTRSSVSIQKSPISARSGERTTLQRVDVRVKECMRVPIEDKAHWTVSDVLNGEEWERTHMFRLCDHDFLS